MLVFLPVIEAFLMIRPERRRQLRLPGRRRRFDTQLARQLGFHNGVDRSSVRAPCSVEGPGKQSTFISFAEDRRRNRYK